MRAYGGTKAINKTLIKHLKKMFATSTPNKILYYLPDFRLSPIKNSCDKSCQTPRAIYRGLTMVQRENFQGPITFENCYKRVLKRMLYSS